MRLININTSTKQDIARKALYALMAFGIYGAAALTPVASSTAEAAEVECAEEGETCRTKSKYQDAITTFRYKAKNSGDENDGMSKYFFVSGIRDVSCSYRTFGDGIVGKNKKCSYYTNDPMGIDAYRDANFKALKKDGEWITLPSQTDDKLNSAYLVRYGRNEQYVYQIYSPGDTFLCSNDTFNLDPYVGKRKLCYYTEFSIGDEAHNISKNDYDDAFDESDYIYGEYTECATDGQTCDDIDTNLPVIVRYGADDRWVYHVASGKEIKCGLEFFEYDPYVGERKNCDYRKMPARLSEKSIQAAWVNEYTAPSNGTTRTHSFTVTKGISNSVTESSGEEWSNTLGASITASVGDDANFVAQTISFESSYLQSKDYTEVFEQSQTVSQSITCSAPSGVHLSVWKFELYAEADDCESGSDCDIAVDLGLYLCSDELTAPKCTVGDYSNCFGADDDIVIED